MTDKKREAKPRKPDNQNATGAGVGEKVPAAPLCNGLNDASGEFRIENITFGTRNGGNIMLRQANTGREIEVGPTSLEALIVEHFFTEKVDVIE